MSSSTESYGDEVYQPQESDDPAETRPDMDNALDEPDLDETLDSGYSPPERPLAIDDPATTAEGRLAGENLDQRLAREVPEPDPDEPAWAEFADEGGGGPQPGPVRAGRLAPAEEAAMHIIEEPDEGEGSGPNDPDDPDGPASGE
ncbi:MULTISPECIES: hypothetical protein [unclassified Streptomyces]|uniref:hypothetical protein n=1 Tax=unclassified Streptomyces TaxID=2593676 RepID=UPI002E11C18F|nr:MULTISPECIES: hypothetical protein [unclassified Streptomyces]WSR23919.1 hypothetical protein OG573_35900 [Streptomyces sp. NBC_01205]